MRGIRHDQSWTSDQHAGRLVERCGCGQTASQPFMFRPPRGQPAVDCIPVTCRARNYFTPRESSFSTASTPFTAGQQLFCLELQCPEHEPEDEQSPHVPLRLARTNTATNAAPIATSKMISIGLMVPPLFTMTNFNAGARRPGRSSSTQHKNAAPRIAHGDTALKRQRGFGTSLERRGAMQRHPPG